MSGAAASAVARPLAGLRVLEIAGLAPVPFAGMMLADFGADVIRVDRKRPAPTPDVLARGKRSVALDFKSPLGKEAFCRMADKSDVLIEPFRPGVMERLGLGPEVLCKRNERLIYARLTGWGQTGSMAKMAGHDLNYIAISGVLSRLGRAEENPGFPVNILGDFAGGGMLCSVGIMLALLERAKSGKGQVVDAAMLEGASYLAAMIRNFHSSGFMAAPRGRNMLDSGAHFYDVYRTRDDKFVSVGAIEPQFYAALLDGLGLTDDDSLAGQMDMDEWPAMKKRFAAVFASKTRDEWEAIFDGTDACVAPVLELDEVNTHPHTRERKMLIPTEEDPSVFEAAAAPRLSRTPGVDTVAPAPPQHAEHSADVLAEFGFSDAEVKELVDAGAAVLGESPPRSRL